MSILTDFFIARPTDIDLLDDNLDHRHFPHVQAKRIDHIKSATLDELLTGEPMHIPDPIREAYDGDISVVPIRQALADSIIDLKDEELPQIAAAWAATEEWLLDGGTVSDLVEWLYQVRDLAKQARATNTHMYVWMCL